MPLGKENLKSKVVEGHKVFLLGEDMLPRHFQGQLSQFFFKNQFSIKQIKRGLFKALLEIKSIKNGKNVPFVFLNKGTPSVTLLKLSLTTHLEY
jgi:hypothetical protein